MAKVQFREPADEERPSKTRKTVLFASPQKLPSLESVNDDVAVDPFGTLSPAPRKTLLAIDPSLLGVRASMRLLKAIPRKSIQSGNKYVINDMRLVQVKYKGFPRRGIPGMPGAHIQLVGVEILDDPTGFGGKNSGELQYPRGAVDQLFSCSKKGMGLFMSLDDFKKKVMMTEEEFQRREFMDRKMRQSFYHLTKQSYSTRNRAEFLDELEEDPVFFSLSRNAKRELSNRDAVAKMCRDLHRCIDLIETHIPNATKEANVHLTDGEKEIFETHVIQELLYRAQQEKLSVKIRMDFGHSRRVNLEKLKFTQEEIAFMVKKIAWIRNNIVASAVTDENDAKMAVMGAKECLQALTRMLKAAEKRADGRITNDEVKAIRDHSFKF